MTVMHDIILKCIYVEIYVWKSCKICGFHFGDYEEWRLLGYYAVWLV
jgi:hypothetical protein